MGGIDSLGLQFLELLVQEATVLLQVGAERPDRYVVLVCLLIIIEQHRIQLIAVSDQEIIRLLEILQATFVVHDVYTVGPFQNTALVQPLLLSPDRCDLVRLLPRLQLPETHLLLTLLGRPSRGCQCHLLGVVRQSLRLPVPLICCCLVEG